MIICCVIQVSILQFSVFSELSLPLNLGMDKGNLKINKHLFLQYNKIKSDAHYLKRVADPPPLSCVCVFLFVCLWVSCALFLL